MTGELVVGVCSLGVRSSLSMGSGGLLGGRHELVTCMWLLGEK